MEIFSTLFGWLPAGLEAILKWLATSTGSAGLAIIIITLLIRFALYPLTKKQTKSLAAMRELQPKLNQLKEKYKDKPQEYQKKLVEAYQQAGVNPLGGCLPVLVQFPFLIALFYVLRDFSFEGIDPHFLIWNLTEKDTLYILPVLAGVTTYFQTAATMTDPAQRAMLYIMPVMIGWFSINFPAGLVLYWVVSNLFSIGQHYVLMKDSRGATGGAAAK